MLENTKLTFATGQLAKKWAVPPTDSKTKRDKKENLSKFVDEKLYAKQQPKVKKEKPRDKSVQSLKKKDRDNSG